MKLKPPVLTTENNIVSTVKTKKGMDTSMSLIVVFVIAIVIVLVISAMLTGGFGGLEEFAQNNIVGIDLGA